MSYLISVSYGAEALVGSSNPNEVFKNKDIIKIIEFINKKDFAALDKLLLDVPIDSRETSGETILWWQANIGNLEGFNYLLRKGANPSMQVSDGPNILELCAMQENVGFIKAALKHGANLNMISQFDRVTPIFAAVLHRRYENVKFMVDSNACIDVADTMGTTPVLLASDHGSYNIVVFLLEKGANPLWKNIQGHNLKASLAEAVVDSELLNKDLEKARDMIKNK